MMMKMWLMAFGLWLIASAAYSQTCTQALAAKPQGPFPCSVTASWQDNSDNETGFILERRLNGGPWGAIGGVLAINTTSVVDATLQQSATTDNLYEYRVSSVNQLGPSAPSNLASFTIPKAISPSKPPSNLIITFKGADGRLDLDQGRTTNLKNDDGTFTISASSITIEYQ